MGKKRDHSLFKLEIGRIGFLGFDVIVPGKLSIEAVDR